jgi:hypothetical protein
MRGTIVSLILLVSFPQYSCCQEAIIAAVDDDDISDLDDIVGSDSNAFSMMDNNIDAEFVAAAECDITSNIIDEVATPMTDINSSVVNDDKDEVNTPIAKITEEDNEVSSVEEGATTTTKSEGDETSKETPGTDTASAVIQQVGPFVDLLGDLLLSLEMIDETKAQVHQHHTNVALQGKNNSHLNLLIFITRLIHDGGRRMSLKLFGYHVVDPLMHSVSTLHKWVGGWRYPRMRPREHGVNI